jgi:hypothetical protein
LPLLDDHIHDQPGHGGLDRRLPDFFLNRPSPLPQQFHPLIFHPNLVAITRDGDEVDPVASFYEHLVRSVVDDE